MRHCAFTVLGAALAVALLPRYLGRARAGHADRWAPHSYAAVAVGMLALAFWAVALAGLLR